MNDSSPVGLSFTSNFCNTINGRLTTTTEERCSINPATEKPNPEVPVSTTRDVEDAVSAADAAYRKWAQLPQKSRRDAILRFADALEQHSDKFAELLTMEQGKPVRFAADEIRQAILWLRTLSSFELKEEIVAEDDDKMTVVRYLPLGVVVGIVPWNFPIHLACGKIAPALVTGNTIIIKPSPYTPYCNLKLGELAQNFFPPGVLQVLSGDDKLGPWLVNHPIPAKISFTGSTVTGKAIMSTAARSLKRITLELGGNDPAIVCKDIDVDGVAQRVGTLALYNSGQVCVAIKRIYVHEAVYDQFRDSLIKFLSEMVVGAGTDDGVFLGPLQNKMQYEKVNSLLESLEEAGNTVISPHGTVSSPGYFINPALVDNPPDNSSIVSEEPFGPVFPIVKWNSEEEVIQRANDSRMGLGASVWSNDLEQADRIARKLEAGSVWINTHQEGDPRAPFGGIKESGLGSEWGLDGLKSYCNTQSLFLKKRLS